MLLFYNGNILTQDKKNPKCEAVLVEKNIIVEAGNFADLQKLCNDETEYYDLEGKTIMPGFVDAHIHIWKVGNLLTYTLDLRETKSIVEILEKINQFCSQNPDAQFINARGFNESNLIEKRMISKKDLDSIAIQKPIIVQRTCAHISVINSFAIEKMIENKVDFNVNGGKIDIESGTLYETAQGLVSKIIPHYSENEYIKMIEKASDALLEVGVTTACDPAVMPDLMDVYETLNNKNDLKIRVNAVPVRLPDGGNQALPLCKKIDSEQLVVNTVKFFADGGLSGKTAALRKTYKNSDEKGILRLEKDSFFEMAAEAQKENFIIATHAIGDDAIDLVIDVYEKLYQNFQISNRIEHLGLPDSVQLKRIKSIQANVVSQPVFIDELGKNFIQYLDESYLDICYPYKSILEEKIDLAFSTDAPVVKNLNPFQSIQCAVTRKTSDQQVIAESEKISVEEAIYAYTFTAAKILKMEKWIGSIEKGKLADLIILNQNPLTIDFEKLTNIDVYTVFFNGKCVKKPSRTRQFIEGKTKK